MKHISYFGVVFAFLVLFAVQWTVEAGISTTTEVGESSAESANDALDWHDAACTDFHGAYARKPNLGIVCCNNQTMLLPTGLVENWETNLKLVDCTEDFTTSNSPDLTTALWNVTLCVFRDSSAFPQNKVTFKNFLHYMTGGYTEEVIKELTKSTVHCEKETSKLKDPIAKMRKFFECFHSAEKKVCDKPFKTPILPVASVKFDKKYDCPEMVGLYGNDRTDYCCKKQSVPYNFLEFYLRFPVEEGSHDVEDTCAESFDNQQLKLDPKLKQDIEKFDNSFDASLNDSSSVSADDHDPRERLIHCNEACHILATNGYSAKYLVLNYDQVITNLTSKLGKKIQKDLKTILTKQKSLIQFSKVGSQKKLTFDELNKKFKVANELAKIKYYCEFAEKMTIQVERALHEYCFDKNFADIWFKNLHNHN